MNRALAKPRLRILGPIEAWCDDRRLDLGGPRQVALLAYLLVHGNQAVPSDVLLEALWGPTRCGADNRLPMAVARLRKSLSPLDGSAGLVLRTVRGGYLLSLGPNQLDAELFTARVRDGLRAAEKEEPQIATTALSEALALWRGPPLADVLFEDFAQGEIRRLEALRRLALETRIDAELRLGRHRELISELEYLLAEHPTCERITAQLMLALYRSDRQAAALEVYDRTRLELSAQFGLQPGPTLKALQADILLQAPSLEESAGTRTVSTRGALPQSPLMAPSQRVPVLYRCHVPDAIESGRCNSTRAEHRSTCVSLSTKIRWQGSSQNWCHEYWPQAQAGHQDRFSI